MTFTSPVNSTEARLSFYLGFVPGGTTVWISTATLAGADVPTPVMRREFECGVVILNGDTVPHNIAAGSGLKRLTGQQAPRHQYFVDDNSSAFKPSSSSSSSNSSAVWVWGNFNSGYKGGGSEEVRPVDGFYHHWERGAHTAPAGSSATFDLQIPATGKYTLKMWWPAAVPARAGWATAMAVTVASGGAAASTGNSGGTTDSSAGNGTVVASMTVDLANEGGDVWYTVAKSVQLAAGDSTLTISCPSSVSGGDEGGTCVADAVLVESEARRNDGSAVVDIENENEIGSGSGGGVALQSMDAIILARTNPPSHCGSSSARLM